MDMNEECYSLLASLTGVDLNTAQENSVFMCPADKKCIITKIMLRGASVNLDTVKIRAGWNTGPADDVLATTAAITLTATNNFQGFNPKDNAVMGSEGDTFKIEVETAEGEAATGDFDVFGYLV